LFFESTCQIFSIGLPRLVLTNALKKGTNKLSSIWVRTVVLIGVFQVLAGDKFSRPNAWELTSDVSLEAPITFFSKIFGSNSPFWLALEFCRFVPSTPAQPQ
jgi:hypothetical protein